MNSQFSEKQWSEQSGENKQSLIHLHLVQYYNRFEHKIQTSFFLRFANPHRLQASKGCFHSTPSK